MTAPSFNRSDAAAKARNDFNGFLNAGMQLGSLAAEHVRARTRQPENEVFVRQAFVTVRRVAPSTSVSADAREVTLAAAPGPVGLAEATALWMERNPALARYLGTTGAVATPADPLAERSRLDLFASLHAFSQLELARRFASAPGFATGAFTVIGSLSGLSARAPEKVAKAADSVFCASFADVHAISLIAAVDGAGAALSTLDEVVAARQASGEYAAYSVAPMSRDTSAALQVLRAMLAMGSDFATGGRDELLERSVLIAADGMAAWMQRFGVSYKAASDLAQGLESVAAIVAAASAKPAPQPRSHPRPA